MAFLGEGRQGYKIEKARNQYLAKKGFKRKERAGSTREPFLVAFSKRRLTAE